MKLPQSLEIPQQTTHQHFCFRCKKVGFFKRSPTVDIPRLSDKAAQPEGGHKRMSSRLLLRRERHEPMRRRNAHRHTATHTDVCPRWAMIARYLARLRRSMAQVRSRVNARVLHECWHEWQDVRTRLRKLQASAGMDVHSPGPSTLRMKP